MVASAPKPSTTQSGLAFATSTVLQVCSFLLALDGCKRHCAEADLSVYPDYGNEKECGDGIARAIKEGLVQRSELFITGKLWTTYYEPQHVEQACKRSLDDWGLDYFDLYLLHFPFPTKFIPFEEKYPPEWEENDAGDMKFGSTPIQVTWTAMESLVYTGLVKSIGVANFQAQLLLNLVNSARIKPALLQIEHHPYLCQPLIIDLAKTLGIQVTAYSSMGPTSFRDFGHKVAMDIQPLLTHPWLEAVGKKHGGKTAAQVLLRWSTQRGIAVIPKSLNPDRMLQNLDCCSFDLDKEDMNFLNGLDRGLRFNDLIYVSIISPKLTHFTNIRISLLILIFLVQL